MPVDLLFVDQMAFSPALFPTNQISKHKTCYAVIIIERGKFLPGLFYDYVHISISRECKIYTDCYHHSLIDIDVPVLLFMLVDL